MDVNERISIKITEMLLGCSNDNTKNREEKVNYSINNIINSVEKNINSFGFVCEQ